MVNLIINTIRINEHMPFHTRISVIQLCNAHAIWNLGPEVVSYPDPKVRNDDHRLPLYVMSYCIVTYIWVWVRD